MARGKSDKLKPFQKLLTIMAFDKPVTLAEIDAVLGKEIHMYRLSTYVWHIKTRANGVVKAIKDGRKVTAYQIVNVDEMKSYLKRIGASSFTPGQSQKIVKAKKAKTKAAFKPKVAKLNELKAVPVVNKVKEEVMEVTEVTEKQAA